MTKNKELEYKMKYLFIKSETNEELKKDLIKFLIKFSHLL